MKNYIREVAIAGLVVLETTALLTHTDGAYFAVVVAAIAGIAGYAVGVSTCEVGK